MALTKTDAVDVLDGTRVIATLDAHGDNRDAMRRICETWRGGVIAKAQAGDTSLSREDVLGITQWRQSLTFKQLFMDGSKRVHKHTESSQRLADSFGRTAYKATQHCIDSHVEHNKEQHAELLRKNSAKYQQALEEIEREETAADRLRDKITSIKDPKRRQQLKNQYSELFQTRF